MSTPWAPVKRLKKARNWTATWPEGAGRSPSRSKAAPSGWHFQRSRMRSAPARAAASFHGVAGGVVGCSPAMAAGTSARRGIALPAEGPRRRPTRKHWPASWGLGRGPCRGRRRERVGASSRPVLPSTTPASEDPWWAAVGSSGVPKDLLAGEKSILLPWRPPALSQSNHRVARSRSRHHFLPSQRPKPQPGAPSVGRASVARHHALPCTWCPPPRASSFTARETDR